MHKNHILWLSLPLLATAIFAVSSSYLPGKVVGGIALGVIIVGVSVILVVRGKSLFGD